MPSRSWERKIVRDPLYGFTGISALEDRILSSYSLQRLARIKQLAHAYIVFPSATHSRLEHSIGTISTASRMCEQLDLSRSDQRVVRIAALLHDVGHGPFSHVFEDIMRYVNGDGYSHEQVTKLVVEFDPIVKRELGNLRDRVLEILDGDSILSEIVSGSLDADKMDYLRRDSYHTGVAYGQFDFDRILRAVCKVHEEDRDYIGLDYKGQDAIESYRLARYSMHSQVYEHHTRLIADDMFVRAVQIAIKEDQFPLDYFDLRKPEIFLPKFLSLDDGSIENFLLQNCEGTARVLIEDIRARRLLKRAYVLPLTRDGVPSPRQREKLISMSRETIANRESEIAKEAGLQIDQVIIHVQSVKIKLYERFEESIGKKEKPILIRKRDGSVVSLDEESPIYASTDPIRRLYVFSPPLKVKKVKTTSERLFGAKSFH